MSSWPHDSRPSLPSPSLPSSSRPTIPAVPVAPVAPFPTARPFPTAHPFAPDLPTRPVPPRLPGIPAQRRSGPPGPRTQPPTASYVTLAGADWLASASRFPRSVHALWADNPAAPVVLPCGGVFDVVGVPALFGRRVLDRLWAGGPGSGPVAAQRGRLLLFAAPGTAQRLPALLGWEEWARAMPPLLCHGTGDAVTVPPLYPPDEEEPAPPASRWLVAPEVRHPWLPDAEVLLWACVRVARTAAAAAARPVPPAPDDRSPDCPPDRSQDLSQDLPPDRIAARPVPEPLASTPVTSTSTLSPR
ncbi:hypothetical protein FHS36_001099 [Streptomyces eurocidicus]|uniref:DNA primase/polymerase bifunctional N-terminal domain-containing protein n=1 Tax=Streptomyces eurocidicus TaxID=66423 RepID=A0A7W8EZL6_STREU|nr:hypothetical protein [Streptomyces eurocidicus]